MKSKSTIVFLILAGFFTAAVVIGLLYAKPPFAWLEAIGYGSVYNLLLVLTPVMLIVFLICLIRAIRRRDRRGVVRLIYALMGVSAGLRICQHLAEWQELHGQLDPGFVKSTIYHAFIGTDTFVPFLAVYSMLFVVMHKLGRENPS